MIQYLRKKLLRDFGNWLYSKYYEGNSMENVTIDYVNDELFKKIYEHAHSKRKFVDHIIEDAIDMAIKSGKEEIVILTNDKETSNDH